MANKVLLKKSSVAEKVPLVTDLDYGELAINYTDEKLYFKNASNVIKNFTANETLATVTARGASTSTAVTLSSTSNHYSGHFYYDPYDAAGNHYPHFTDGSNGAGVTVNWRLYTGGTNSVTHTWTPFLTTFNTKTTINGAGTATDPALRLNISNSASFVHAQEIIAPSLTADQTVINLIGYAANGKNSGYIGYKYSGTSGSNSNLLTLGHWGSDHLVTIDGVGNTSVTGNILPGGYVRMGTFSNSVVNTGEAWIGRATDRSVGTMTVQLGNDAARTFEVVDHAWSQIIFDVGMNAFTYKGNTIYHSGNIPTWNQDTTGNAATVANLTPAQFFNNMGNNHGTYTDFNNIPGFGTYYVQAGTNSPTGVGSHQWYGFTIGLGNEYALSQYASQFYWPREAQNSETYLYIRDREGGSWGNWRKIRAGYADSAGSADNIDGVSFNNSNNGNPVSAADTLNSNGVGYVTNVSILGQTDGALYSQAYSADWQHQIYGDYRTGLIAVRGKNSGTWQSWRNVAVLNTDNSLTLTSSSDAQLLLNGNGTEWAGIAWTDSSSTDYLYYRGSTGTFSIGGGGSTVSGKKLHINGGTSIGANVGGSSVPTNGLLVEGSILAQTKSFLITHPTKPGKKLRYGSLEGPENGVYVRGKLKGGVIELPEYWTKLVDPDSITVQLTPIGKHQKLYVEDIRDNKVYVANDGFFTGEINCFYSVLAERADVEKLQVEID